MKKHDYNSVLIDTFKMREVQGQIAKSKGLLYSDIFKRYNIDPAFLAFCRDKYRKIQKRKGITVDKKETTGICNRLAFQVVCDVWGLNPDDYIICDYEY